MAVWISFEFSLKDGILTLTSKVNLGRDCWTKRYWGPWWVFLNTLVHIYFLCKSMIHYKKCFWNNDAPIQQKSLQSMSFPKVMRSNTLVPKEMFCHREYTWKPYHHPFKNDGQGESFCKQTDRWMDGPKTIYPDYGGIKISTYWTWDLHHPHFWSVFPVHQGS